MDDGNLRCYADGVDRADDPARLDELCGQRCWSAAAGLDKEWHLVVDLGTRERRSLRLANPLLSFEQRTFEGSHGVVVEGVWRLDGPEGVIASCLDARSPYDWVREGLERIEGLTLVSARAEPPGHDLELRFDGGFILRSFVLEPAPRQPEPVPGGERPRPPPPPPGIAWAAWTPTGLLMVGPHGRLGDPRSPSPSPGGPRLALVDGE